MPSARSLKSVVAALAAVIVVACADSGNPLEPAATPVLSKAGESAALGERFQALRREKAKGRASVKAVIGPDGGTLSAGGVKLTIPRGALNRSVKIRMTVPKSDFVEARFAPHGLNFNVPATLSFDLADAESAARENVVGVYIGPKGLDAAGVAEGRETFPVQVRNEAASYDISHFSGYIVASGRSASAF